MIYDRSEIEDLFIKGLVEFNNQNFYDAHEYWEDIWRDYKLDEPLVIQGLIQFTVGCFHMTNLNRNGAISLLNKSIKKLEKYENFNDLKIDISDIVKESKKLIFWLKENSDLSLFDWSDFLKINLCEKNESI